MKRTLLVLMTLTLVSGCGLKGALDRPPPMWGDRTQYDQQQQAERDRKRRENQSQQTQPQTPGAVTPTPLQDDNGPQPMQSPGDAGEQHQAQ